MKYFKVQYSITSLHMCVLLVCHGSRQEVVLSIRSKRYDFISGRGYFIDHNPYAAKAHAGMPKSPLHHHFMCKDHLGISQYNALVVVELLGSTVLVWVVLISTLVLDVVLIIQVLSILLGVSLGLLTVDEVHSLGLSELVDFSTGDTDEEFLGELVGYWLAL